MIASSPTARAALPLADRLILDMLRRHGDLERTELAALTGLARSTLTDALARLRGHGLVEEGAADASRGRRGRPATVARLARAAGVVGVVSLTHGTLRGAAVGFDGAVLGERVIEATITELPDGPAGPGVELLDSALANAGLDRAHLACAVMGVPLPFRSGVGLVGSPRPPFPLRGRALPEWTEHDPADALAAELGVPAWCENDANLGALGEQRFGVVRDAQHLVYIKIAQGIGAGIIVNGELCRGASGLAGEMLHLHVSEDGPVCICGGRGCLLMHFNTPRLVDIIQPAHSDALTVESVFCLAGEGDPGAIRVLVDMGRLLGRSLADICVYLNLEAIVIDGMLGDAAEAVMSGIRTMIDRYSYPTVARDVSVVRGSLGAHAELLGAVAFARDRLSPFGAVPGRL